MANRSGPTFTDVCGVCGSTFAATTKIGAQNQALACQDNCAPPRQEVPLDVALNNARRELGDW